MIRLHGVPMSRASRCPWLREELGVRHVSGWLARCGERPALRRVFPR
jgi:hypothetical protein